MGIWSGELMSTPQIAPPSRKTSRMTPSGGVGVPVSAHPELRGTCWGFYCCVSNTALTLQVSMGIRKQAPPIHLSTLRSVIGNLQGPAAG